MEFWQTEDDIDYDMFTISEFTDGQRYKSTKTSKNDKKTLKNEVKVTQPKSLYDIDDFSTIDEAEKQKIARKHLASSAGRGYVLRKFNNVNRSNTVMSPYVLEQTERDIREVCPMGYSNEVIEASFKNVNDDLKEIEKEVKFKKKEDFKFTPSSDVSNGAIPKKFNDGNLSSKESNLFNDLPTDFIEYNVGPNFKLNDNREFPKL